MRNDRLKIAVLVKRFMSTGGLEKYACEITRRLLEKGHAIDLYARVADEDLSKGMTVYRVPDKYRFLNVLNSLSFAVETARMLRGRY